jgi:hypothetical protein
MSQNLGPPAVKLIWCGCGKGRGIRKGPFITGTRRERFEGDFLSPIGDMFMFSIKNIVFILMICFKFGSKMALSYLIYIFFNF